MNFAADALYVSQCEEAALLGLFHVRVTGYNYVRHWLEEQKVVLAQKEGSAAPGWDLLGPAGRDAAPEAG